MVLHSNDLTDQGENQIVKFDKEGRVCKILSTLTKTSQPCIKKQKNKFVPLS